jgi:hypothetical protein
MRAPVGAPQRRAHIGELITPYLFLAAPASAHLLIKVAMTAGPSLRPPQLPPTAGAKTSPSLT